jgi:hypothetical protein
MRHQPIKRATSLLAAAVYLLAIALSSLSHVHVHALGDGSRGAGHSDHCAGHAHDCEHADADHLAGDHHEDGDDATQPASHTPAGHSPTAHDDDCNICQFLGRPILAVTPFALAETSEHVVPLPADAMPDLQPIVVVATQARAPPGAAISI